MVLFAADKDRIEEEGNTAICIGGSTILLLSLAMSVSLQSDIKNPLAKLFALAIMNKIK